MNKEVLDRSYVIIGPVGTGKTLTSSALSKETGLPVITSDILRHCPKTIKEIEEKQQLIMGKIQELEIRLNNTHDENARKKMEQELNYLKNEVWICNRQKEMRTILPNVPNYEEMGFNGDISHFTERFGKVAWHFYQKQFENRLLMSIMDQLNTPAILDMGGGMAISLDDQYAVYAEQMMMQYPELFKQHMNMNYVGFDIVQREFAKCPNVVNLVLPKNYQSMGKASGNQTINDQFIASGQFEQLADINIPVDGLINGDGYNPEVLNRIVDTIKSMNDPVM